MTGYSRLAVPAALLISQISIAQPPVTREGGDWVQTVSGTLPDDCRRADCG